MHKSVMGGEGVPLGTRMTHRDENQKEVVRPTTFLTPKAHETWNARTMFETGSSAQIAAEMVTYSLSILGMYETRWKESGCIGLSTNYQINHGLEPSIVQDYHSVVLQQGCQPSTTFYNKVVNRWESHHSSVLRTN